MVESLTVPQRRALQYLASVPRATPSQLGEGMGGTRSGKAQGLGRLGGTMARRLMSLGMAVDSSRLNSGFPAYAISHDGRLAIAALAHSEREATDG
jgi:hypothetical protein